MTRVLLIDNYDSFTHNLSQPLLAAGHEVHVARNDALDVAGALALEPERVILSPGPKRPEDAGVCLALIAAAAARALPLLGVCLGHQALAQAFGGKVVRAERPLHGRATSIRHDGRGVLRGLANPLLAARYHSLIVAEPLPAELVASAWSEEGELMGLRHRDLPLEGVQFHPESFLTPEGERLLLNFVSASGPALSA